MLAATDLQATKALRSSLMLRKNAKVAALLGSPLAAVVRASGGSHTAGRVLSAAHGHASISTLRLQDRELVAGVMDYLKKTMSESKFVVALTVDNFVKILQVLRTGAGGRITWPIHIITCLFQFLTTQLIELDASKPVNNPDPLNFEPVRDLLKAAQAGTLAEHPFFSSSFWTEEMYHPCSKVPAPGQTVAELRSSTRSACRTCCVTTP